MLEERINEIIENKITKYELQKKNLLLLSNKGKDGKETSKSLIINELPYPCDLSKAIPINRSAIILNILKLKDNKVEVVVKNSQFSKIELPEADRYFKEVKSDKNGKHLIFTTNDEILYEYIEKNIVYSIENYEANYSFGCCSRLDSCTKLGRCIHQNRLYATGCMYRKRLAEG